MNSCKHYFFRFNYIKKDRGYLQRMPYRRDDNTIFLSIVSYRDDMCLPTIRGAFKKAENPEKLSVGIVQQNFEKNCKGGHMKNDKYMDVKPDEDCHKVFCDSPEGKPHCDADRIHALHIGEDQALGPYLARYFASKIWHGEQWYMQVSEYKL